MKNLNLVCIAIITTSLLIGCSKSNCEVEDWLGTYNYISECSEDTGNIIEVDEHGNPIEQPPIESIVFTRGDTEGTISFDFIDIQIDGCEIDLDIFGQYTLNGDMLTVDFGDNDCKIFQRQ